MFEGKKDDPVNKTTWIPESFTRALEEYAASQDVLLNCWIIQCCQYAMAHRKKDDSFSQQNWPLLFSLYQSGAKRTLAKKAPLTCGF